LLGENTHLGPGTRVEAYAVLRGIVKTGRNCFFGSKCCIWGPVELGSNVFIGELTSVGFPDQSRIIAYQEGRVDTPYDTLHPVSIGDNGIIRAGTTIYASVKIGRDVRVGHNVLIREQVEVGDYTVVGTGVIIDGFSYIGSKVSIQSGVYIPKNTTIEDYVFLGPNCILTNDKYVMRVPCELKGPTIRRGASIGAGAILMPGIEIGEQAVVGAGAVVTKDVPPKKIVYGIPARIRGDVPETWKSPFT